MAEEPPGTYDICGLCGYEDDPVQFDNQDFRGGANRESLNECRAASTFYGEATTCKRARAISAPSPPLSRQCRHLSRDTNEREPCLGVLVEPLERIQLKKLEQTGEIQPRQSFSAFARPGVQGWFAYPCMPGLPLTRPVPPNQSTVDSLKRTAMHLHASPLSDLSICVYAIVDESSGKTGLEPATPGPPDQCSFERSELRSEMFPFVGKRLE